MTCISLLSVLDSAGAQCGPSAWTDTKRSQAEISTGECRLKRVGEAAALVASLQAQQAELVRQIAEAEGASGSGARVQERGQAQRAAERGADADVAAAEQALGMARRELEAAARERDSLYASSSQVRAHLHPPLGW